MGVVQIGLRGGVLRLGFSCRTAAFDWEGSQMQFAVLVQNVDSSNAPPQAQVALVKRTFQMLASNQEPRIKAMYPFAGERAGILIVDVSSGEELQELIGNLPFAPVIKTEIHAIGTVQAALKTVEQAERRISEMAMAGAGR